MATIEALKELGANTEEGLARCMNNENFYLKMVDMGLKDKGFQALEDALSAGDLKAAFESAHALKGILSNLALTPLSEPMSELTELLRAGTQMDYSAHAANIRETRNQFLSVIS